MGKILKQTAWILCIVIIGLSLFTGCRSARYSHKIELTDRAATPQEIIDFYKDISFYVSDDAEIAKKIIQIKQKVKMGLEVSKRTLDLLHIRIQQKCKKKKKLLKRFYSRLKMLYLYGDASNVSVKLTPVLLFQKPTKKYKKIIDTVISVKSSEDKSVIIPCGFYNIKIYAKLKAPVNVSCIALPNDTYIVYFATSPSSEQITAYRGINLITLKHGTGYLCINSTNDNATFNLKAPFKIKTIKNKSIDFVTQKVIDKYPELKDYYSSPDTDIHRASSTSIQYRQFIKILQTESGTNTIKLPTPIFLALPAGEYIMDGKKIEIEDGSLQKIWIK